MKHLFVCSQECLGLAFGEIERLAGMVGERFHHLLLLEAPFDVLWRRLAFTRSVHEVLFEGSQEAFRAWASGVEALDGTLRIDVDLEGIMKNEVRAALLRHWSRPEVNLERPDHHVLVFERGGRVIVGQKVWVNEERFIDRASHRRPAPHPTALPPKLARCMVNLAGPVSSVLDPFCGAGGILLEAGLMGLRVVGCDIDGRMLNRAQVNLERFGVEASLVRADAREFSVPADAVVTDLPYGRNSRADDLVFLYDSFLTSVRQSLLVVAFPSSVDVDALIEASRKEELLREEWYLHRSLKKMVVVLQSSASSR